MDLVVAGKIAVELKSVNKILPIHQAQLLTYLRLSGMRVGFLINFNVRILRDGIVQAKDPLTSEFSVLSVSPW